MCYDGGMAPKPTKAVEVTTPRFVQTQATVTERDTVIERNVERMAEWPTNPAAQRAWIITLALQRSLFGLEQLEQMLPQCDQILAYINDGTIPE